MKLYNIVIVSAFFGLLNSCGGRGEKNVMDYIEEEKVRTLKAFEFVYDMKCVYLNGRERADTTFRIVFPDSGNSSLLVYAVTGDCSFCIAVALDFIRTWSLVREGELCPYIVVKNSPELFKYYLKEEGLEGYISSSNILSLSDESIVPDGVYLIYERRIIKYASWKI